ncbi:hypothetical protein [Ammoniphilus sp. 3BR4]
MKKKNPKQTYNPEKEANEVMTIESQYVSGEKFASMPVDDEESLREQ